MTKTQDTGRQQARARDTIDRLLKATLSVIKSEGWAGTSTPKICQAAEVSRGAQTHHFPTRSELMMAALERTASDHEAGILQKVEDISEERRTLEAVLRAIWDACIDDHFMQPSIEAMVAARTDESLHEHVAPRDKKAIASMRSMASQIAGTNLSESQISNVIELSLYLFRGIAIERGMHQDAKYRGELFDVWVDLILAKQR